MVMHKGATTGASRTQVKGHGPASFVSQYGLTVCQDDQEAQAQIQQMVKFILNEAKDKAQEIEARALEDFNIEKLKLVQQMKDKIRQEFDKKAKKLEVQRSM